MIFSSAGQVSVGQMHDLLLAAMQEADEIIRDKLNGFNFHRVFSSQQTHLVKLEDKLSALTDIRTKMTKVPSSACSRHLWHFDCYSLPNCLCVIYRRTGNVHGHEILFSQSGSIYENKICEISYTCVKQFSQSAKK